MLLQTPFGTPSCFSILREISEHRDITKLLGQFIEEHKSQYFQRPENLI